MRRNRTSRNANTGRGRYPALPDGDDTPTDADRLELDLRAVGDIAEALLVFDAANQLDHAAEAVLRVSRAQGSHGVIPAILARNWPETQ